MDGKLEYIKCLVYFGYVDNDLHELEKEFIRNVGKRIGVDAKLIEQELNEKRKEEPKLPNSELMRFILLDDLQGYKD